MKRVVLLIFLCSCIIMDPTVVRKDYLIGVDTESCPCYLLLPEAPEEGEDRYAQYRSKNPDHADYYFRLGEVICPPYATQVPENLWTSNLADKAGKLYVCTDNPVIYSNEMVKATYVTQKPVWDVISEENCRAFISLHWKPVDSSLGSDDTCCCRDTADAPGFEQCYYQEPKTLGDSENMMDCIAGFGPVSCSDKRINKYKRYEDCITNDGPRPQEAAVFPESGR